MLYIFNKTIPKSKNIVYSLTLLFGINKYQSTKICKNLGINPQITINKLKKNHVNSLIFYINKNLKIEQKLRFLKKNYISNLLDMKTIRGIRQNLGLPVRGQRTHTNAKTCKKFKKKNNSTVNKSKLLKKQSFLRKKKRFHLY